MIDPDHQRLSIRRQCELVSISRASFYRQPAAESPENLELMRIIDEATSPWGIKVTVVEVKDVEIPSDMQRAMARQAEAERERRAKVISAEGEFQASERLKDAAAVMAMEPITVQLRYLQTLLEIGSANNSTIVFPIPVEFMSALLKRGEAG